MADPVSDWLEACERLQSLAHPDQLCWADKLPFTGLPVRMRQLIENHHGALARLIDDLDTQRPPPIALLPCSSDQFAKVNMASHWSKRLHT